VTSSQFKDRLADQERLLATPYKNDDNNNLDEDELEEKALEAEEEEEEYDEEDDKDDEEDAPMFLPPPDIVYAVPLPQRLHVPILDLFVPEHENNEVGTLWLDEGVFGCDPIRVDLMKKAVNYWRAKKRGRRKAHVKGISEISGSGRKLRPQKGQGRARVGHSRPPQFRGGVKVHGPKNTRDYGKTKLNRKVRQAALRNALSQKLLEGNLMIANQLHHLPSIKTKELAAYLGNYDIGGMDGSSALILDSYNPEETEGSELPAQYKGVPANFWVASNNIPNVKVNNHISAVVYHILRHEKLILTLACVEMLERRLKLPY